MTEHAEGYSFITVEPLSPHIGAMISGVDLNGVTSDAVYEEIRQALWKHHVIFFRRQALTPEAYLRLGSQFGEMEEHEFFPHVDGYPQIQTISNEGNSRPGTDRWHTDVTFRPQPSMVTILRAMEVPPQGGDTCWMSTAAAFDHLDAPIKRLLLSLEAVHDLPYRFRKNTVYQKLEREGHSGEEMEIKMISENPPQTHPAIINHPVTGRLGLFVNSIWTKCLRDIHEDIGDPLLNTLYEWVKKPDFCVRFKWEKDSVAIWDNFGTQHYALFDYAPHYRAMQRMTAGSATPALDRNSVPQDLRPRSWD